MENERRNVSIFVCYRNVLMTEIVRIDCHSNSPKYFVMRKLLLLHSPRDDSYLVHAPQAAEVPSQFEN